MSSVSVIIPTYNGGDYILDAVNSVLQQSCAPMEIIVVDDGSQEDILGMLSPVSGHIKYIRQDNAGPAAARNSGIRAARGKFIAFLDDDDLWHPAKIERQMREMHQNQDCGLVYSFPILIDENGSPLPVQRPKCPSGYIYYDLLRDTPIITASSTLLRASVLEKVGVFDEDFLIWEDYDLWLRIAQFYRVTFCSDAITYYRQSSCGVSKDKYGVIVGYLCLVNKLLKQFINSRTYNGEKFIDALRENLRRTFRTFAYEFYYEKDDRINARHMLMAALRTGQWNLRDILFLAWFSLPGASFEYARNVKRSFFGPKPHGGLHYE
jgi:glycosyltransferase involved in cell wall biosynthesis